MRMNPDHDPPARQRPHPIVGLPTAVTLFIGCATHGPTDIAVRVRSRADCEAAFGPPDVAHAVGHSVGHYFDNGGVDGWVIALSAGPTESPPAGPDTPDFEAALAACFATGGAVDRIGHFDLLCVPGESGPSTVVLLQAYCARRGVFYLADCPSDATAASLAQGPGAALQGDDAACSAMYAPWVIADDSSTATPRPFPPCGFVAGVFARIDAAHGVWKAPAGIGATLVGASGLTVALASAEAAVVTAAGFDTLMTLPGRGIVVWSARTLRIASGEAEDRYVPVRRLSMFIESSVRAGTTWTRSVDHGPPLWTGLRSVVSDFLHGLFLKGAFAGATVEQAYYVRCDTTTTTQADLDNGRLVVQIGVAPLRPAEFVVVRIVLCARRPR